MKQRQIFKAIAAAIFCFGFVHAHAGLIIENQPVNEPLPAVARITMTQVGVVPAESKLKRVPGGMKNQPLAKVLGTLVPRGWNGYAADPRVKAVKSVTFTGGNRAWPVVLEEILRQNNLTANLNWDKREITVGVSEQFAAN